MTSHEAGYISVSFSPFSNYEKIIMISFDKFTIRSQESLKRAQELASEYRNPELKSGHLLKAMLSDEKTIQDSHF